MIFNFFEMLFYIIGQYFAWAIEYWRPIGLIRSGRCLIGRYNFLTGLSGKCFDDIFLKHSFAQTSPTSEELSMRTRRSETSLSSLELSKSDDSFQYSLALEPSAHQVDPPLSELAHHDHSFYFIVWNKMIFLFYYNFFTRPFLKRSEWGWKSSTSALNLIFSKFEKWLN